ncbi:chalcone isomerase family protein [Dechloromonas sp.]|uniref:chalcone isomerase family protein n=1 Tax=Dechloromonas sp. TaxID=1917218 RepID=UPI00286E19E5|nr:chalcone isomerase family protein [Dechloromonas sp.]
MSESYDQPEETAKNEMVSGARRRLLLALAAAPSAAFANTDPTAGLKRWGNGEFRRFGFLVYEATLWAGDDPQRPPLALRLDYKRTIAGAAIAEASVKEMRALGADEAALKRWGEQMTRIFPDVKAGDFIVGQYETGVARFYFNGRLVGEVADADFARAFFGIWLDAKMSAPGLRAALLRRSL